ncbi:hypothetical protein N665_1502s0016 [Sinapis alba]|nr:hypothetical protein N665_1502s0016 [Sinapis alba]
MTQEEQQKNATELKTAVSNPSPPSDDSKALVLIVPKETVEEKKEGSANRDEVLARLETEKRMSLIKAWEEAEKSKVENKAQKKLSSVGAWENSKKASVEAELKKIEKRAMTEAKRGEEILKAEEMAAKYRATGTAPTKSFGCF